MWAGIQHSSQENTPCSLSPLERGLERVTRAIAHLCQTPTDAAHAEDHTTVYTDSMKRQSLYRFGKNEFALPELADINRAAYWDYQRNKIYVRSSPRLKRVSQQRVTGRAKTLPINKEHSVILTLLVGAVDAARIPDRTCRYTWRSEVPTSHCYRPRTTRLPSASGAHDK